MTWETQSFLWLLLLVPAIIALTWYLRGLNLKRRRKYFSDSLFEKLTPYQSPRVWMARHVCLYSGIMMLFIALAGPKIGTEVREVKRKGIDMIIALDVSQSMLAEDVRPSRLSKAKFEIYRLVDRLRGDRIGLMIFTGESHLLSPLTTDYSAFRMYLNIADTDLLPSTTTNFSAIFSSAIQAFDTDQMERGNAARVLLIVSDGEDHGPEFRQQMNQLIEKGVFIYTVGIGTPSGATIPIYDRRTGRLQEYKRDENNIVVTTALERENLQQIARAARGQYYEILRSSDGIDPFLAQIDELDKREFASEEFADYKNQYQFFGFAGLILFLLYLLIPQYKSTKPE